MCRELLIVDLETTGVDPMNDSIIELAAVRLDASTLTEIDVFQSLVRPSTPISDAARAVHGLGDSDLEDAPSIEEVLPRVARLASPDVRIGGHNVSFDVAFLKAAFRSWQLDYPFDYHVVDVWSISWFVLSRQRVELPTYGLDQLRTHFGLRVPEYHSALEDARASAEVLRQVARLCRDSGGVLNLALYG